jgi:hypothetical protein
VSKAITLGVLGNLPVVYDELGDRDPMVIRELITMFTNGRDKMRGTADGSIQHTQAAWQTLMVSGSNISLHDILANTSGSDALAYRVLEFHCQLPDNVVASKGDRLRKDMEANAGWAGDEYINYLMQPGVMAWVQEKLAQQTAALWDKHSNKPEHRFWMRTLGAVSVAGALVNQLGILEFDTNRVVEWALSHIGSSSLQSTGDTRARSIALFGEFLAAMTDSVLVTRSAFRQGSRAKEMPLTVPRRGPYMRYELDQHKLYVAERILKAWLLEREIGSRELIGDLERVGLVVNRRAITLTAGTDIVGAQMPCIEVDGNHLAISGTLAAVPAVSPASQIAIVQDNHPAVA